MTDPPELRFEDGLYQADPDDVLAYVQALSDDVTAAMVVGHNPTAHALSQGLIRSGDKKGHSLAVRAGFPTCALGRLFVQGRDLVRGRGPRAPSWSRS